MAIRTYGLSGSGMDVDQMVKDMMSARREQYDKLWQKKTQLEWKKTDYNTMYNTIQSFRNTTAFNYRLSSTTIPKIVTSSAEGIVTATANADAANVSRSITVGQLAQGANVTSTGKITEEGRTKDSLMSQFGLEEGTFAVVLGDGSTSKTIQVDTSKSIYDFVSDLNKSGLKIRASYDATLDRFNISTTGTGEDVAIDFTGTTSEKGKEFLEKLQLHVVKEDGGGGTTTEPITSEAIKGKDAEVVLDGATITHSGNTFTAFGVTYTLKATGDANIHVSADNDKAVSVVKDFVDQYNALLETINSELNEAKYKSYMPLTNEMKGQLGDSQITQWEEMARSGLLRNDSTLQSLIYKLRNDIATPVSGVEGKYNSLSAIGVTTGKDYLEGGKLYLDETELKKALEADPDIVNKLFGSSGEDRNSQGAAVRIYDSLKSTMDNIKETAGITGTIKGDTESTLAKQIRDYEDSLDRMNDRLSQMEERYYKQFNAMELALSKLSQQSSWLANMFSSGN
ncbi:flagellar hook-associated 2 domain protein [Desulfitobacterium hafniense DCB-2]|uniref:Flagellar hook-associated protein 2 n=1 Tax=Desulfitobacterium hafniense (strain DSM 10664 / DCB-2) TaxID=272564 RepID=B8FTT2_DESHD|nr:flagellar filament capping protein FliD [Desulfitobacterium hafniense]ACL22174.1 flagellar hook-associated 2 domain protein [Desulfitobacterium hafniense DCB-2]